jgi:hypothetical protein
MGGRMEVGVLSTFDILPPKPFLFSLSLKGK